MPKMQRQAHPPRPTPAGQAAAAAAEGSSRGGAAADSADTSSAGPVGQQQQQQRAALSVGNGLAIRGASGAQFDTLQQQQQQRQSRNRGGGGRGRGTANGDVAPGGSSSGLGFHRLHPTSSPGFAHQQGGAAAAGPSPRLPANGPRAPLHNAGRYDPSGGGGGGSRLQQQQRIHHQHWASPPGQANIPRPGSSFRPPSHPAGPPQQATASTSISGPWPHGRGHPGPSSSAAHAHVRPMSAKAKKADPFAHLPVYDYQTFPSSRAGRPTLLVVSDPALVDELVGHLGSPVGLDIEWAPTFQAGAPVKPTSLLQISDGQTIVVVQLLALLGRCPPGLRAFLEDENIVKLGVGILPDGTKLSRDLGVECRGFYDLNGLRPPDPQSPKMAKGLAALTGMYTSHRLHKSKNVTMSNWALAKLSPSQIAYAANDVQSAVDIYAALRAEAEASNFTLRGPPGWSWTAPGAIPSVGKRVSDDLFRRVAAAPGAADYSSSGFYPPGFERAEMPSKAKKPDPNTWWAQAVELFREGRSLVEIGIACKPPSQQARSSMDVRFGIANYLSRRSESLTADQGKTLLAGLTLDTKGRIPLTLMVEELVRRG